MHQPWPRSDRRHRTSDLTCLSAAVIGQALHPRFLIHDSPREADLNELVSVGLERARPLPVCEFEDDDGVAFFCRN